jgi:hypothetical protein
MVPMSRLLKRLSVNPLAKSKPNNRTKLNFFFISHFILLIIYFIKYIQIDQLVKYKHHNMIVKTSKSRFSFMGNENYS